MSYRHLLKYFLFLVVVITFVILYFKVRIFLTVRISKQLISKAVSYKNESSDLHKTLLVLGDSTAVGVGANQTSESIPALIAEKMQVTYTENYAVSGSVVSSLPSQIEQAKLDHYDIIFIQIGANNIVARDDAKQIGVELEEILWKLKKRGEKIIFTTAGDVGGAPAIPYPIHYYYKNLSLSYHKEFEALAKKLAITYVNLYDDPRNDPFKQNSQEYFAKDGFHPSTLGYAYWFSKIERKL